MKKAAVIGVLFLTLILNGCDGAAPSKMTIEPYEMSEQESALISKTGVGNIVFFKLNGTLDQNDDLEFSVEVYENGKFKEELFQTWGALEGIYKDTLISFGISDNSNDETQSMKLISGIPSGLATTNYTTNMTASTVSKLVNEKIAMKKNEPVYLVVWVGTTKNSLRSIGSENGELPSGIEEFENALIYKVLWTGKEKE